MSKRLSELPAASSLAGDELVLISRLSPTVRLSVTTIAFDAADQVLVDSANGFLGAGFAVGQQVRILGVSNDHDSALITALTAGEMTVDVAGSGTIVDAASGGSTLVALWESMRTSPAAIAGGQVSTLAIASGVVTIDARAGDYYRLTLNANVATLSFSNLPVTGQACSLLVEVKQDATGGRTLALPGSFRRTAGSAPAVASAANALTLMALSTFDGGSTWWATLTTVAP